MESGVVAAQFSRLVVVARLEVEATRRSNRPSQGYAGGSIGVATSTLHSGEQLCRHAIKPTQVQLTLFATRSSPTDAHRLTPLHEHDRAAMESDHRLAADRA